jgi:NAD(P)H-dependent FMN reductase
MLSYILKFMNREMNMKTAIIIGSPRLNSNSGKVAEYMAARLTELNSATETDIISLAETPLPLWDESMWGKEGIAKEAWLPVSARLKDADSIIVVAAEWNGTVPAGLTNLFNYTSMAELGHKAGLIVGVTSGGTNGVYPVAEVRSFGFKNCKVCYMPDHLIIRNAGDVLVDGADDTYIRDRIDYTLNVFSEYTKALNTVRASGVTETEKYKFGM